MGSPGRRSKRSRASPKTREYADVGAQLLDAAALVAARVIRGCRRMCATWGDWMRRHYGLRELIVPEKYRVDTRNAVVVTYSSCLAQVYFADDQRPLTLTDIARDPAGRASTTPCWRTPASG